MVTEDGYILGLHRIPPKHSSGVVVTFLNFFSETFFEMLAMSRSIRKNGFMIGGIYTKTMSNLNILY